MRAIPPCSAKGDGKTDDTAAFTQAATELDLSLDFKIPDHLAMLHRQTCDRKIVTEAVMTNRDKDSPLHLFRHGSYGVKVSLAIAE